MAKFSSFQNEVPPSRINIRYVKDIGDAQEKVELPLKLMLVGDYAQQGGDDTPVEERERIRIDKNNFENVMKEMNLKLSFNVPNRLSEREGDELKVALDIKKLRDFTPDRIVEQVPELREMIELRRLLTDLKAKVITNREFRQALDRILVKGGKDAEHLETIRSELGRLAPLPDNARVNIHVADDEDEDD
ncbi:MAG: type VI secretion system contractile sheath small subunit [Acidobacteriota bacterium]